MVRDDASVRVSLRAGKAPVLGAEYYVQPFSKDPLDVSIAEFVEFNLFHGMTITWIKFLEQALTMYEAEKSVFEPVWELREWAPKKSSAGANRKQYTMLRKLAFRPPLTLGKVTYDDNGGPVSIAHTAIGATGNSTQVDLPIEKLLVFTFDQQGGGLEGMSILRSAYKHWFYKDKFYAIDAIQKEHHGIGVPYVKVMPGAAPADIELAHIMARNLRTNEFAYIVAPSTLEVGFAEIKNNLVNVLESADHHDIQIMKYIMVQFLNMGVTSEGGGRATGATGMDMFLKAMRHIAGTICDGINMYLIPNMVAYNFPTDRFPTLCARGVGEVKDMQMFSSAINNLVTSGAIQIDEYFDTWVRQQIDAPALVADWIPPDERPTKVQELIQETGDPTKIESGVAGGNGNQADNNQKSNNGGGGNIGKSPSSGA
jgi:hypothetical protein